MIAPSDLRAAACLALSLFGPLALVAAYHRHEGLTQAFGLICAAAIVVGMLTRRARG